MTTIKEISQKAGVSIATVSKVMNGKSGVTDAVREKVLAVARELNYHPNLNARYLKSGSSRTIGIITEDLTVFNAPEIIDGIAADLESAGYHYILSNLRFYKRYGNGLRDPKESDALVHSAIDDMLAKQVDGIIYIGFHSHVVVSLPEHSSLKFVCAYCVSDNPEIPSVIYNDEKAAFEATKLLLNNGCRKIGMITGPSDSIHSANRIRGHQLALYEHEIPYNPHLTVTGDWGRDCGNACAETLISMGVDGIFVHNDIMAVGVMDYCAKANIVIGKDLKLVGFDNREISSVIRPALSTVSLPLFEIGQKSAEWMLRLLNHEPHMDSRTLLDCTIIERESTKSE